VVRVPVVMKVTVVPEVTVLDVPALSVIVLEAELTAVTVEPEVIPDPETDDPMEIPEVELTERTVDDAAASAVVVVFVTWPPVV